MEEKATKPPNIDSAAVSKAPKHRLTKFKNRIKGNTVYSVGFVSERETQTIKHQNDNEIKGDKQ